MPASDESNDILNKKIAEYSWAVLNGRPNFHISLVIDVSPYCDCHAENDVQSCLMLVCLHLLIELHLMSLVQMQ